MAAYHPQSAWRRALVYFAVCLFVGWWSGALAMIFGSPWGESDAPGFVPVVVVCFGVILVGYGYVWPKGTLTHGRSLNLASVLSFGLLWGISEGVLFVSVWLILARWLTSKWLIILLTFLTLSTFKGLWHSQYWDIYVSPEHNIEAWNLRKVLLAHTPNLVATMIFLTFYEGVGLFVLWQTMALLLSAYFMRFPPFWGQDG